MARRTRAREILHLPGAGMPGNAISRALSVPKRSVRAVAEAADERGIGWAEAEAMGDAGAYEALFPEKVRDRDVYAGPDWERIHGELARDGVTPKRLHAEYRDALLAKAACQRRMRAHYVRCPDLEDLWRESRERPGGERKLTRKYATFQVLVLDEWLLDRPGELFRGFLLELMGARYGACSTVFCTQFRQKDWHARLGGGVHADAIMDRIVLGTAWVEMGELNMRRKLGSGSG